MKGKKSKKELEKEKNPWVAKLKVKSALTALDGGRAKEESRTKLREGGAAENATLEKRQNFPIIQEGWTSFEKKKMKKRKDLYESEEPLGGKKYLAKGEDSAEKSQEGETCGKNIKRLRGEPGNVGKKERL